MQSSDVLIDLAIIAALWLMARYVLYLFRLLQKESTERRATGRGHTWRDTAAIVAFLIVVGTLAAYGAPDRTVIRLVMVAIAVYVGIKTWRGRSAASQRSARTESLR